MWYNLLNLPNTFWMSKIFKPVPGLPSQRQLTILSKTDDPRGNRDKVPFLTPSKFSLGRVELSLGRGNLSLGSALDVRKLSKTFSVEVHIQFLHKRLIIYTMFDVITRKSVGRWN